MQEMKTKNQLKVGFTLVEIMVASTIFFIAIGGALAIFITFKHSWTATTLARMTSSEASIGLTRIIYGVGTNSGLRAADASTVAVTYPAGGWLISYDNTRSLQYDSGSGEIVDELGNVICEGLIDSQAVYMTNGCEIMVTVSSDGGGRVSTNQMTSFVQFRN